MKKYYYINETNQKMGPFLLEDLIKQPINNDTLVWHEDLTEWKKASEISNITILTGKLPLKVFWDNINETPPTTQKPKNKHYVMKIIVVVALIIGVFLILVSTDVIDIPITPKSNSEGIVGQWELTSMEYLEKNDYASDLSLQILYENLLGRCKLQYTFLANGDYSEKTGYTITQSSKYKIKNDTLFLGNHYPDLIVKLTNNRLKITECPKQQNNVVMVFKRIN